MIDKVDLRSSVNHGENVDITQLTSGTKLCSKEKYISRKTSCTYSFLLITIYLLLLLIFPAVTNIYVYILVGWGQ